MISQEIDDRYINGAAVLILASNGAITVHLPVPNHVKMIGWCILYRAFNHDFAHL